ncbi:MAG: hypothetical protein RLZZ157_243 [Pseudomonadota bacterium]|jgi:hypothetical protein
MTAQLGKSVRLYLAEGTPQGILTAEIVNWTGHVLSAPRSKLAGLLARHEMGKAGVYFLIGLDPENDGQTLAYIGQSENVGKRLTQHNKDERKAFWERTCVITSKDQNLTSGHIKFLESRLIAISAKSSLVTLTNDTAPEVSSLPEADIADMEYFIAQLRLMLPLLGLDFLREAATIPISPSAIVARDENNIVRSPVFEISSPKHKLTATGQEIDGEFVVQSGSLCRASWEGAGGHNYFNLHKKLWDQNRIALTPDGQHGVFLEDISFSSPSAAAAIIYGRASNGRVAWKIEGGSMTYADWQNSLLPQMIDGDV